MRDVGELARDLLDGARPQVAGVGQHVGLVHQRQLPAGPGRCAGERVADDPLDAERGVEALLGGDLVRRALAQDAAGAGVGPLGALADDDHVDVAGLDAGERGGDAR